MKTILLSLLAFVSLATAGEHKELKAFPEAKEGMNRFVIVLPHKERGQEDAFKVELIPGKTMMTDGVNVRSLACAIEAKPLKSWGYTYYEVTGSDLAISTLIGVPANKPKVEQFVTGKSLQIRYNSRLPVVIYAPEGFEVRYRIWSTTEKATPAEKG